jgi:hypothetical protein
MSEPICAALQDRINKGVTIVDALQADISNLQKQAQTADTAIKIASIQARIKISNDKLAELRQELARLQAEFNKRFPNGFQCQPPDTSNCPKEKSKSLLTPGSDKFCPVKQDVSELQTQKQQLETERDTVLAQMNDPLCTSNGVDNYKQYEALGNDRNNACFYYAGYSEEFKKLIQAVFKASKPLSRPRVLTASINKFKRAVENLNNARPAETERIKKEFEKKIQELDDKIEELDDPLSDTNEALQQQLQDISKEVFQKCIEKNPIKISANATITATQGSQLGGQGVQINIQDAADIVTVDQENVAVSIDVPAALAKLGEISCKPDAIVTYPVQISVNVSLDPQSSSDISLCFTDQFDRAKRAQKIGPYTTQGSNCPNGPQFNFNVTLNHCVSKPEE